MSEQDLYGGGTLPKATCLSAIKHETGLLANMTTYTYRIGRKQYIIRHDPGVSYRNYHTSTAWLKSNHQNTISCGGDTQQETIDECISRIQEGELF